MNDEHLIRARRLADGSIVQVLPDGTTRSFIQKSDWERVDAMTEQEVEANALSDPDNPPSRPLNWPASSEPQTSEKSGTICI